MKKVLVTGGCGYIGSHTIVDLLDNGFDVISVDNNVNSDIKVLDGIREITGKQVKNYTVDLCDKEKTRMIFQNEDLDAVIHFAALKSVNESVNQPLLYFSNNLNSLINVLECCKEFGVNKFIFSSSCSVYGNAKDLPVTEESPFEEAECAYARTKQMGEQIIQDFAQAHASFNSILLRYFNPAGAHESGLIGEDPCNVSTNLVPVITETAVGKRKEMTVNGTDYNTRDGSCVRDYIHVMDIATAHTKAYQYLCGKKVSKQTDVFNLGIGEGVSVLEAIAAFEKTTGQNLNYKIGPRREGDVEAIYANLDKASNTLGWKPSRNIDDIMKSAWKWELFRSESVLQP